MTTTTAYSAANAGDTCPRLRACTGMMDAGGTLICGTCAQRLDRLHDKRVPKALRLSGLPPRARKVKGHSKADGPDRSTRLPVTRMPSHPLAHSRVWW